MRLITSQEVNKLIECIQALSEYHNEVSTYFKGSFPSRPYAQTLSLFEESVLCGSSQIAVIEDGDRIIGFCKIDITGTTGKLDYLIILQEYRGCGYGKKFMDWAMGTFEKNNVDQIEVKVIDGNTAVHLYESYGFHMHSHIMKINR